MGAGPARPCNAFPHTFLIFAKTKIRLMFIQQLYTNCLAEAAYYIESDGEAAIVDPIRETEPYIALANSRGAKIKYVFETHFHADFVSGHIDLARATGAKIVFGPQADTQYEVYNAEDEEEFRVGKLTLRALHTPGHTPESTCYLLLDAGGQEYCVFTGDTLFVGDVGRPDLLDGKMSREELASMLYDSLNNKIKKLRDEVIVYPAHGPGSSCGKNIGKETWSTIGQQKKMNYALRDMPRQEFIDAVTRGLAAPPAYFFEDARINKEGYTAIDEVVRKNKKPLSVAEFLAAVKEGATVLDTRSPGDFEKGFIKNSINIGLDGTFAIWVGTLINIREKLVLVCAEGKEDESVTRLARVGFENIAGYLAGGFDSWKKSGQPVETVLSVEPEEFASHAAAGASVLDVLRSSELEKGHVKDTLNIPLAELAKHLSRVPKNEPVYIYCASGYRSVIAASLLKKQGYGNVINVHAGWNQIKSTSVPAATGLPENTVAG
jgi:glyoxylase-like metal-dependent hydrolase (beta-lactamase superfamily II)/rhodanese-related sulfurtransferase